MPIETHIDGAVARVDRERTHVEEERGAYERFRSGVTSLSPQPATAPSAGPSGTGGGLSVAGWSQSESTTTHARRIRELFAETIHPYSVADLDTGESLLETIQEELGDSVAFVLAPETDADVTPGVQERLCSTVEQRQRELEAMGSALERERASLRAAASDRQAITEWVVGHNQTSLLEFGFSGLRRRHEQLSGLRDRCEGRLRARQETIQATTSRKAEVGAQTPLGRHVPLRRVPDLVSRAVDVDAARRVGG